MKKRHIILAAVTMLTNHVAAQQSTLSAGDLVFVAANADAPDPFAFIPLVNIKSGTVIHFSDNSRTSAALDFASWRKGTNGDFSESPYFTYVAPSNISAGTRITISDPTHGGMGLATSGDTLLAFQGDIYNPKFITGVGWTSTAPWITSGTASANNSYLPSNLALTTNAVGITANLDNSGYTGTTSGTTSALRSAINTPANWTSNDATIQSGPTELTISDAAAAPDATKVVMGYSLGFSAATYSEAPTVNPLNLTLSNIGFTGTGTKDLDGTNALVGQALAVAGGWDTTAIDSSSQYFKFSVTVSPAFTFSIEDFAYTVQSSEIISTSVFYSTDAFATSSQLGSTISTTATAVTPSILTGANVAGLAGTLEFRIYGHNAATGTGTLEVDEIWLQGSLSPVPEPSSIALLSLGLVGFLRRRRSC